MKIKCLFILMFLLLTVVIFSQDARETPGTRFKNAGELYSGGKYKEALDGWLELYNSGYRSASLEYNIGNAYFKLNNIPGSILFYERARLLKPGSEDIRYNLQIAKSMVVDKITGIPEMFFVSWFNFVSLILSSNTWALLSIASFVVCLLFISLYFYTKSYRFKVLGFWLGVFLILICGFTFSFSSRNRTLVYNNNKAIIMAPVVNGKSSPDPSGNDLFVIHEGTKVTVGDKVGEWYEIKLSDGNKGWVPVNCLARI